MMHILCTLISIIHIVEGTWLNVSDLAVKYFPFSSEKYFHNLRVKCDSGQGFKILKLDLAFKNYKNQCPYSCFVCRLLITYILLIDIT